MLRTLLSILLLISVLAVPASAAAQEYRMGFQAIRTGDHLFRWDQERPSPADPTGTFFLLQGQYAWRLGRNYDLAGLLRFGSSDGAYDHLTARVLVIDPGVLVRRRFALQGERLEAYVQAALSVPLAQTRVAGVDRFDRDVRTSRYAAYPLAVPAAGIASHGFLPGFIDGFGVAAEVGYATPVRFGFGELGQAGYGGLTWGLFASYRP
jgi:hypothetical protein